MKGNFKNSVLKVLLKHERSFNLLLLSIIVLTAFASPVAYASPPKLVTGTVDFFRSATAWLLIIIPVGAGFFLGYHAFEKSLSNDQAVIAEKNKLMKNVLIGSAIAVTASGAITIFLSFYV